jgi:hypothetical protein
METVMRRLGRLAPPVPASKKGKRSSDVAALMVWASR